MRRGPADTGCSSSPRRRIEVEEPAWSPASAAALASSTAALLRKAEREFRDAVENLDDANDPPLFAGRMRARLTRKAQREVYRHFLAIQRVFDEHRGRTRGRMVAMTSVLSPVPDNSETP